MRVLMLCVLGLCLSVPMTGHGQEATSGEAASGNATAANARVARRNARQASWSGLESSDRAEIRRTIAAVQQDGSFRAVRALHERIQNGLPPQLLDQAIDALTAMGRGSAARVLLQLVRHRRAEVRAKVAAGVVATRAPNARRELYEAMVQVAETGQGPKQQIPSMGCSIKWRA